MLNNCLKLLNKVQSKQSNKLFSTLVLGEHNNNKLSGQTLNALNAASKLNNKVSLLLINANNTIKNSIQQNNINKIIFVNNSYNEKEDGDMRCRSDINALSLKKAFENSEQTHVLAGSTQFTKDILFRLSGMLNIQPVSEITKIISKDEFIRYFYAGNAIQKIKNSETVKIFTVRGTAFEPTELNDKSNPEIETINISNDESNITFVSNDVTLSDRAELNTAKIIVSGGRGLKEATNFKLLEELSNKLGKEKCAIGATRAVVDAGWIPNDLQIGQTGKVVAPDLQFAIGISGAIQHLAGMKDSKVIVAINKDADAPIFNVSDYGIVADLFDVLPELCKKL